MSSPTTPGESPTMQQRVERAIVLAVLDHYEAHDGDACRKMR
jgi:hypothetical protein